MSTATTTNDFGYNPRSELIDAAMGTNKYGFIFDNIGNRESYTLSTSSGQATNSETLTYLANALNQYTNIADGITNTPTYDLDGNMLTHNGWTYSWNGENRMVQASNATHVVEYSYDFMGRMFLKVTDGETNNLVWDGFNIISECSTDLMTLTVSTNHYVWGLDLSGSLQGAGGVGGLLATIQDGETYFTAFDGNGNVSEYVDDTGTNIVAHREYSPFGVTIVLTGTKKDDFTHWRSSKPWDAVTGMSEYELRKYLVDMGRWGSKDPMGEKSFADEYLRGKKSQEKKWLVEQALLHAYLFVQNQPPSQYDIDGATTPPPSNYSGGDWRTVWRERYEELRRRPNEYGPKRACDTVNSEMGASVACASLGWQPEPNLYCGCRTDKIREAGNWLRQHGDEVPAVAGRSGSIGSDKLAHCYTYCVATYWWYVPGLFHWLGDVGEDSDPNDVVANEAGFRLGRSKIPSGNPCDCLNDCTTATYNMTFD